MNAATMQEADYRIVPYRPEYKAQIVELQKGLWSPSAELNAAYLDWKHLRNPYLSEPLVYLAMCGERVVGMRSYFGTKWQFGAPRQTLVVPSSGDLIVAPEFRNRGIMTRLIKASLQDVAANGYPYIFSMSAGPTTLFGQMGMGWRSIGSLRPVRCVLTGSGPFARVRNRLKTSPLIDRVYQRFVRRASKLIASHPEGPPNRLVGFDRRVEQHRHRMDAHMVVERAPRPQAMADLIARMGEDERFRHVRDAQYFAWRFQNPRGSYRFLYWEDERLEGYLALYANHYGPSQTYIVDWEGASPQVSAGLIQGLVQLGGPADFYTWSATLGDDERRALEEAGFQRVEESISTHIATVLVHPMRDDLTDAEWLLGNQRLLDLENWRLRMIYSEGF